MRKIRPPADSMHERLDGLGVMLSGLEEAPRSGLKEDAIPDMVGNPWGAAMSVCPNGSSLSLACATAGARRTAGRITIAVARTRGRPRAALKTDV